LPLTPEEFEKRLLKVHTESFSAVNQVELLQKAINGEATEIRKDDGIFNRKNHSPEQNEKVDLQARHIDRYEKSFISYGDAFRKDRSLFQLYEVLEGLDFQAFVDGGSWLIGRHGRSPDPKRGSLSLYYETDSARTPHGVLEQWGYHVTLGQPGTYSIYLHPNLETPFWTAMIFASALAEYKVINALGHQVTDRLRNYITVKDGVLMIMTRLARCLAKDKGQMKKAVRKCETISDEDFMSISAGKNQADRQRMFNDFEKALGFEKCRTPQECRYRETLFDMLGLAAHCGGVPEAPADREAVNKAFEKRLQFMPYYDYIWRYARMMTMTENASFETETAEKP